MKATPTCPLLSARVYERDKKPTSFMVKVAESDMPVLICWSLNISKIKKNEIKSYNILFIKYNYYIYNCSLRTKSLPAQRPEALSI